MMQQNLIFLEKKIASLRLVVWRYGSLELDMVGKDNSDDDADE